MQHNEKAIGVLTEMSADSALLNVCATQQRDRSAFRREAAMTGRRRAVAMAEMYTSGKTLAAIGREFGISAERVRQILSKIGISGVDGGRSIRTTKKWAEYAVSQNARYKAKSGCTREQWLQIPRNMRHQCWRKRGQVTYEYGAQNWAMTQWEYYLEVKKAGVEIARGGIGMTRIDRDRPFAPGNVKFVPIGSWTKQRSKES